MSRARTKHGFPVPEREARADPVRNPLMNGIDFTPRSAEENLRIDEELLDRLERSEQDALRARETLRFWESPAPVVVLGRGGNPATEVYADACVVLEIPVLRRPSGGGTVVLGPGCLNYSLVLSLDLRPEMQSVPRSYEIILAKLIESLGSPEVERCGLSDLVWRGRKFSGNAQKRTRHALLHQGTLLYGFDATLLDKLLPLPPRQPAYRNGRPHAEFITNFPIAPAQLKSKLIESWRS